MCNCLSYILMLVGGWMVPPLGCTGPSRLRFTVCTVEMHRRCRLTTLGHFLGELAPKGRIQFRRGLCDKAPKDGKAASERC